MTSSVGRKPNFRRRFFWLSVFIVVLFGGYSVAWFYVAGWLEKFAVTEIARFNQTGRTANCARPTARGFPFRIGLFCDSVRFEDPGAQVSVSAAAFRSAAQVYDPFHIVAELDSPVAIAAPGGGEFAFDWRNLQASLRLGTDFPEQADAVVETLAAGKRSQGSTASLLTLGHGEAHMRQDGADLDLAASFDGAAIDPQLTKGAVLPPLRGEANLTINNGVAWARAGAKDLRGRSGTIRTLQLFTGDTTGMAVTGTFAVGADGLLEADLKVTVNNPKALGEQLAAASPQNADRLRTAMSGLAMMGDNPSLPLKVSRGKAKLGFIPLPDIPAF
jgi:hypothetical protein